MSVDHALENISDIAIGFDVVKLGGLDQRCDRGPAVGTAVTASKQMVFATERHRPDRPLDRIGIELDTAIIKEPAKALPAHKCIADGLG